MPWDRRIYRKEGNRKIIGTTLNAFIHNGDFHLTEIDIYKDGMIDCWELVNFATFKKRVRSGWVCTRLPEGASVFIPFLARFKAREAMSWVAPEDFIREVTDEIEELNGRPTTSDRCRKAYENYQQKPTETNRRALCKAYEAIPEHNRRYVLRDMDAKDGPIRHVIYVKPKQSRHKK